MRRRLGWFVIVATVVLALDQGSKAWAHGLPPGEPVAVIEGYWDWQLAHNDGVAFSLLRGGGQYLLAAIALIAVVAVGAAAARGEPSSRVRRAGYALIAGGALGNAIDRLRDGAVTDFVRWHVHDHMWPIFNLADAALVIGVALALVSSFFERPIAAGSKMAG